MAIDIVQFQIEQIRRILKSMGWDVIATDSAGDSVRITAEKKKEVIEKGS